jgi:hypothetical protein
MRTQRLGRDILQLCNAASVWVVNKQYRHILHHNNLNPLKHLTYTIADTNKYQPLHLKPSISQVPQIIAHLSFSD